MNKCTSKLSGGLYMSIYTVYIGRYVTRIFTNDKGVVHQNDDIGLDMEGNEILLKLKFQGYQINEDEY